MYVTIQVVNEHKRERSELARRQKNEITEARPHTLTLIKARHEEERVELEGRLGSEIRETDQRIILELDQLVTDQQSTLQQAAVPFFTVTNNNNDNKLMNSLLIFILRLCNIEH